MSDEVKQYKLGIIAPRSFQDYGLLEEILTDKLLLIRHIVGNGVSHGGKIVEQFADNHKISKTIYPITAGEGGVFRSNWSVVKYSDAVYIFDDGESKNVNAVVTECKSQGKKYKVFTYTPYSSTAKHEKLIKRIESLANKDGLILEKTTACTEILKLIKEFNDKQDKAVSVES